MRNEFIELGELAAKNWFHTYGDTMLSSRDWSDSWGRWVVATGPNNPTLDEYNLWQYSFLEELKKLTKDKLHG